MNGEETVTATESLPHDIREFAFVHSNHNNLVVFSVADKLAAYLAPVVKFKTVRGAYVPGTE